jgi:foldase protein PrsA
MKAATLPPPMVRLVAALCAILVPAAIAVGCGGVPGNAVATVDGESIEKSTFEHWLNVAAKSAGGGQPGATTAVPKPPTYTECIAAKRKALPKPGKGQPKTTDAQLKTQCKTDYENMRKQALQLLINAQWIQGEADELKVKVSDADVKKSFNQQKKQAFPKAADYQKFLKDSGRTEKDILFQIRFELLSNKIRDKIIKGKDKVSDAQIAAYYNKNKQRFAQPERRDLRIVLTKGKAKAQAALSALKSGQSWKAVTKEFSIDQASKSQGGKLPAVTKGSQEKALDEAVFKAKKNKLVGPVKTQFGYYVVQVTKVTKASQQSLEKAKPTIKQLLASQNQQKALDTFVKDFQKKWKGKTECREGFVTQECKNAPKAKPTPTPSAGAPPQQNGQQAPPTATPEQKKK